MNDDRLHYWMGGGRRGCLPFGTAKEGENVNENELAKYGWYRDKKNPSTFIERTTGNIIERDGKNLVLIPAIGTKRTLKSRTIADAVIELSRRVKA